MGFLKIGLSDYFSFPKKGNYKVNYGGDNVTDYREDVCPTKVGDNR